MGAQKKCVAVIPVALLKTRKKSNMGQTNLESGKQRRGGWTEFQTWGPGGEFEGAHRRFFPQAKRCCSFRFGLEEIHRQKDGET